MNRPAIRIVGCGPGALDYLTPLAHRAIGEAEVLVGAKRLLDLFPQHLAERVVAGADVEAVLREIDRRRAGHKIAVLVTGDPGLSSLARPVLKRFGREACEVIPGISSVQAAFARIGVDWLDARIIDAHGADPKVDFSALADAAKIAVLGGRPESLRWVAGLARTLGTDYAIYCCEELTLPGEKVRAVQPAELEKIEVSSRTIILLIRGSG